MTEAVRRRFLEVNGDHPMTDADDAYVRAHFVPADDEALALAGAGRLPLPSYYLSDGTAMVPRDLRDPAAWAGGVDRLHDWFVGHWGAEERGTAEEEWEAYLSGQYVCLASVTPLTVQEKTRWIEQAKDAVARLEQAPRDPVGRGLLAEATTRLEAILLPMTGYDRLRFGGPLSPGVWVSDLRRDHLTPDPPPLPLRTERLVLRQLTPDDADDLVSYLGDPEVARFTLFDPWTPPYAAARLRRPKDPDALNLGIEVDGRVVGNIFLVLQPPAYCQAEIGWVVAPDVAGRGYATEAATAAVDLLFDHYAVHRVNAMLDPRNDRSAALCERLGMRREAHQRRNFWSKGEWADTFEYAVLADEWAATRRTTG